MAHNVYIRGPLAADWPFGSDVDDVEFAAFDAAQFKSINGDDGGTWAPTDPIIIGGAGLDLTSTLVLEAGGVGGDTTAYVEGIQVPVAWKLLSDWGSTGVHAREYYQHTGGRGLFWAVNAEWNGADWNRDTGGSEALGLELTNIELALRKASAGDPFASWSDALKLNPTNPATTGGDPNTIYPGTIDKAWCYLHTNGGGTFTVMDGAGISAVVNSVGDALFTMNNAMATANYAVQVTPYMIANAHTTAVDIVSTTQFKVRIYREIAGTMAAQDHATVALDYAVTVKGKQ